MGRKDGIKQCRGFHIGHTQGGIFEPLYIESYNEIYLCVMDLQDPYYHSDSYQFRDPKTSLPVFLHRTKLTPV